VVLGLLGTEFDRSSGQWWPWQSRAAAAAAASHGMPGSGELSAGARELTTRSVPAEARGGPGTVARPRELVGTRLGGGGHGGRRRRAQAVAGGSAREARGGNTFIGDVCAWDCPVDQRRRLGALADGRRPTDREAMCGIVRRHGAQDVLEVRGIGKTRCALGKARGVGAEAAAGHGAARRGVGQPPLCQCALL
jgi:hypothetical protein